MPYTTMGRGLIWPYEMFGTNNLLNLLNAATINTVSGAIAGVGSIYIDGRPTSPKTISSAGGSIGFRTGGVTFANGATLLDVGIQDVDLVNGPCGRGDGTFDVKATLTGGGGALTANAYNTIAMTTGSKSIAHGDFIAVQIQMTARGGVDSVGIIGQVGGNTSPQHPLLTSSTNGTTFNNTADYPNFLITFDDGTIGFIDGWSPFSNITIDTFSDASNPDEFGISFQVPFDCKIDAMATEITPAANNSDIILKLYSDPFGTPTLLSSFNFLVETAQVATQNGIVYITLPSEIALTKNTDYGISVRGATGNVSINRYAVASTTVKNLFPGGQSLNRITRNNDTGAFTLASSTEFHKFMVRISSINIPSPSPGGGGGQLKMGISI